MKERLKEWRELAWRAYEMNMRLREAILGERKVFAGGEKEGGGKGAEPKGKRGKKKSKGNKADGVSGKKKESGDKSGDK